jgi:hypothetical protein
MQKLDLNTGSRSQTETIGNVIRWTGICDLDMSIAFRITPNTASFKYGNKYLGSTIKEKLLKQVSDGSHPRKYSVPRNDLTKSTRQEIFVLLKPSRPGLGTVHPPIQGVKLKVKVK